MNGIDQMQKKNEPELEHEETGLSLPENSTDLFLVSKEAILQSDSLLTDTANHMMVLMRGLSHNKPDYEIQRADPSAVHAAVGCANAIIKVTQMRLKGLEMLKEFKK